MSAVGKEEKKLNWINFSTDAGLLPLRARFSENTKELAAPPQDRFVIEGFRPGHENRPLPSWNSIAVNSEEAGGRVSGTKLFSENMSTKKSWIPVSCDTKGKLENMPRRYITDMYGSGPP